MDEGDAERAFKRRQRGAGRLLIGRPLSGRRAFLTTACFIVAVFAALVLMVARQALRLLAEARERARVEDVVPFERKRMTALGREGVRLFQSTRGVRAVARFGDSYFAATGGGLVEFSTTGERLRHYSILDGLPESDLTCLAAYRGQLYIGTRSKGLVVFDGERFERYRWTDRDAQAVTALSEEQGRLLIGTFAGGLLEFDGKEFREVRGGAERKRLAGINSLSRFGPRLYVGTFADGLWVSEAGRWRHLTTADGLPSERVMGVVEEGEAALVATDFGLSSVPLVELSRGEDAANREILQGVATVPALSSVASFGGRTFICKDDGEVAVLDALKRDARRLQTSDIIWMETSPASSDARLAVSDGRLWLLSDAGIERAAQNQKAATRLPSFSFDGFGKTNAPDAPSTNLISALAFDAAGNLWAGNFRSGIDIFGPSGKRLAHLESEGVREINALVADEATGFVLAATSHGIFRFDAALRAAQLTMAEGLPANSVSHLALVRASAEQVARTSPTKNSARGMPLESGGDGAQMFVATSRGLALGPSGRLRTLTTVQGLPSNSVYAVWTHGDSAYAGTLGGLAEVTHGRVVRVFKDANSNLTHNWVTALCAARGRLFVGTYGGGIFELTPSGELRGFASETGKLFVNPNAMWSDGQRLYAGTLDGAWALDLDTQKWVRLRDELPAATVLSVAGRDGQVYFGTTAGLSRVEANYFAALE